MIILYYYPKNANHSGISSDWLYGLDLIREIEKMEKYIFYRTWDFIPTGHFSRWVMMQMYEHADCLLRPTRHDGYSFSVQEALHYGLPVLHTYPIPGVILIKPEIKDIEQKLLKLSEKL